MHAARKIELWVPARCSKTSDHVIVHRGTRLDRADRAVLDGIPITSPTRTLIDYAARLEDEAMLAMMEDAFRREPHPSGAPRRASVRAPHLRPRRRRSARSVARRETQRREGTRVTSGGEVLATDRQVVAPPSRAAVLGRGQRPALPPRLRLARAPRRRRMRRLVAPWRSREVREQTNCAAPTSRALAGTSSRSHGSNAHGRHRRFWRGSNAACAAPADHSRFTAATPAIVPGFPAVNRRGHRSAAWASAVRATDSRPGPPDVGGSRPRSAPARAASVDAVECASAARS